MAVAKLTAWAAKRDGTLNKFYTRSDVGDLLTSEIGAIEPGTAVDLGAGEGSLSAAVARRWPRVAITTVDVDPTCMSALDSALKSAGCNLHAHRVLDVLSLDLPSEVGTRNFDMAVCNPPFYRPDWKREFANILRNADLAEACPTVTEATAEILFLAQSLRLVKTGGTIAIIIPDGLATGWPAVAFRRAILQHHTVRTVVQLPPYSFFDTEAFCFILVLEKGRVGPETPIKLLRLEDHGVVSDPILIDSQSAESRLDYAYHIVARSRPEGSTSLRELGADIRRGSLNTVQRKATGAFVFHTGDFPATSRFVSLGSDVPANATKVLVIAEIGDILMARVDRELHDKITLVNSGRFAITDCVYRIRLPKQHQRRVFDALTSQHGKRCIQAVTKGVGARLIGKGELLDIPLLLSD